MTRIVTPAQFIAALEKLTLSGLDHGLLPETLAIALRLRADEMDDLVPQARAYK